MSWRRQGRIGMGRGKAGVQFCMLVTSIKYLSGDPE